MPTLPAARACILIKDEKDLYTDDRNRTTLLGDPPNSEVVDRIQITNGLEAGNTTCGLKGEHVAPSFSRNNCASLMRRASQRVMLHSEKPSARLTITRAKA